MNNNHSNYATLDVQQQVSLDKHQAMIQDAINWHNLPKDKAETQRPVIMKRLQVAWATLINMMS